MYRCRAGHTGWELTRAPSGNQRFSLSCIGLCHPVSACTQEHVRHCDNPNVKHLHVELGRKAPSACFVRGKLGPTSKSK